MSKFYNIEGQNIVVEKTMIDLQVSDRLSDYIALESIVVPVTEGLDLDKIKQVLKDKAREIKVKLLKVVHRIGDFIQDFINRIKGKEFGDVTIKGGLKFDYEKKDYKKYKDKIINLLSLSNISTGLFNPDSIIEEAQELNSELGDIVDASFDKKDLVINRVTIERFARLIKEAIRDFEVTANQVESAYKRAENKVNADDELGILLPTSFAAGKLLRIFDNDLAHMNSSIPKKENAESKNDLEVSKEVKDAVSKKEWTLVKIMIKDAIMLDTTPNFDELRAMLKYAKQNGLTFDEDDGKSYNMNKSEWNQDYYNSHAFKLVDNFSEKRLKHLMEVVRVVFPVKK